VPYKINELKLPAVFREKSDMMSEIRFPPFSLKFMNRKLNDKPFPDYYICKLGLRVFSFGDQTQFDPFLITRINGG